MDSVNVLCAAKVQSHPESSVGLLTLAGRSARILVTSTRDMGRIFTSMHDVKYDGLSDFIGGIQKAQLALKHRQNTRQRQRIVVFVSSPLKAETEELVKLGKKLKKNNVAVDVVNIGLEGDNTAKIDAFIEAVISNDNSHALHVTAGNTNLADALMNSEIYIDRDSMTAAGSGSGTGGGTGGGDTSEFPFGVDPAQDPELVMALRLSMEDHRARQAAEAAANESTPQDGKDKKDEMKTDDNKDAQAAVAAYDDNDDDLYGTGEGMEMEEDEAEMLRRAIEVSKAEAEQEDKDNDTEKKS